MSRKSALRRPVRPLRVAAATPSLSLDPQDWAGYRREAHKALDAALDHVEGAGKQSVWQPVPDSIKARIAAPLPWSGQGLDRTIGDARELILPYTVGNTHPRFFGWVHGSGTAGGVVAEMLAAAINVNAGGREHAAVYVERQVIEWAKEIFAFPKAANGLLVSGTSMATLIALTAARDSTGRADARRSGVAGRRLVGYASAEAHSSIAKAFEILGLGREALRLVPVDDQFRMDTASLKHQIAADRSAGFEPFAIVATAGTVNTGATDPLGAIGRIARTEKLWLHIDGAFGALARLSPETRGLVAGIEKAHSIAFDFHKWLHVPYDAGAVLIRDGAKLRQSFSSRPDYLSGAERGLAAGEPWYCELGPELSRGFRAFKVWFTLKEHGLERLGEKIADNCRQARYLASLVDAHPDLELMAPVALNIACFRFRAAEAGTLDKLNGDVVVALQEKGIAAPSTTRIGGKLAIRVNLTNHRTTDADLDLLVDAVIAEARGLTNVRVIGARAKPASRRRMLPSKASAPSQPARRPSPILISPADRGALEIAIAEPDIKPLFAGLTHSLCDTGDVPFVAHDVAVSLTPHALRDPAALRVLTRHAGEIALWQRLTADQLGLAWQVALAISAARTVSSYVATLPEPVVLAAMAGLPSWLAEAYRALGTTGRLRAVDLLLGRGALALDRLLMLQGLEQDDIGAIMASPAIRAEAINLLARLEEVALSSEAMILTGGDPRIALDMQSATTGYGSSPRPVPGEISFASSTASSMTQTGFAAVEALRQRLIAGAIGEKLEACYDREATAIRHAICRYIGFEAVDDVAIVLSASGTDTTFAALALARGSDLTPIVSLFLSPDETGSGIPKAAAGCHFLGRTSLGHAVSAGTPIEGLGGTDVTSRSIELRQPSGKPRTLSAIDADVASHVTAIISSGRRCLLHVLDAAKTGTGAPRPGLVARLAAQHGERLSVLVDACQMRISPAVIRAHLAQGSMVQITGSKFFAGPPFSGALLVPPATARAAPVLPKGLGLYCGASEWPPALSHCSAQLPATRNLGILARWQAAIEEIDRFQSVPSSDANRLLERFAAEMTEAIGNCKELGLVEAPVLDRTGLDASHHWSATPTILSFTLSTTRRGRACVLGMDEMKRVHRWMLLDLSAALPATPSSRDQRAAHARCHLGQPVKISQDGERPIAALRLCASARVVSDAMLASGCGTTAAGRIQSILDNARLALDKASLIARHFDVLARSLAP